MQPSRRADLYVDDPGGPEPVVVLVHGAMDRGASFARTADLLADQRVLRYDRSGYGRSLAAGATGIEGQVEDLFEILDGRPAVVVGHSFGGVVALAAAARAPDQIRAVGAYEPPTPWAPSWPAHTSGNDAATSTADAGDAAESFMRREIGDDRWERLPLYYRERRRAEGPALVAELRSLRGTEAPFDAAGMTVPVVIGRGSESGPRNVRATDELVAAISTAVLHVVDRAGHHPALTHPAAYAGYVRLTLSRAVDR